MEQFATSREAKEYLIERILRQADQDGISLTDVERKMLYLTEGRGWTLPDMMAVNAAFDHGYSQDEYENKIARIVQHIEKADGDRLSWNDALHRLQSEDHYLLVLIDGASRLRASSRPPGDMLRLILTGCVIAAVMLGLTFVVYSHVPNKGVSRALLEVVFIILLAGAMYVNRRTTR